MNSSKTRKTQEKYIVKFKFAMKSHFSLTVLTFYFFSYLLICLHWQSYPTIFKGKDFYKNSQILQIQMAIHFLIFRVGNLVHIIKWPIKASFPVHVLAILPLVQNVNVANIVAFDFLVLGRVKTSKSHDCNSYAIFHYNAMCNHT